MHRALYPVVTALVVVLAALLPATAASADQGGALNPNPDTARLIVKEKIRASLPPIGTRWIVYCPPSAARMICSARNPRARYTRIYYASVSPSSFSVVARPPWSLANGIDGQRGTAR